MKKIFTAKKVITVDSKQPFATNIAVDGNKIIAIGDSDILNTYSDFEVDKRFADKIIIPGFIEGHAHMGAGQDGLAPYVGYFDRPSPDGSMLCGLKSLREVLEYLAQVDKKTPPSEPILALGFDPIYFDGPRPSKIDLDKVSTQRMVIIYHASGHLMTVNSKTISMIPQDKLQIQGIKKDEKGDPTGEIAEMEAMKIIFGLLGDMFLKFMDPNILFPRYAALCKLSGVTTITEMGLSVNLDDPIIIDLLLNLTKNAPIRLVPMYFIPTTTKKPEEIPSYVKSLTEKNTDNLRFGHIKMMADGSLQGFTGRVKQPYLNGTQNGIWNQDPDNLKMFMKLFNDNKMQVNCHCNGDEASEAFIEACKEALTLNPWPDNRHVVQHAQLVDKKQFEEMKSLGMCANIFTNHIYYWGDQHRDKVLGFERANRMDAAKMAVDLGVPFSLHCDASVTPIAPLFNIWTAVNRITATGKILGGDLKISVEDALYAMTMGTAYLLRLENEIGSITPGKIADFAVLDKDLYEVDPMQIKDIKVVGTVFGGEVT